MVLSGNSTQANCSRANTVVALSGKEQISPVLLLSDNAPENHNEMEQSCMASVIRSSLRNRKKPVGDKQCDNSGFVNGKNRGSDDASSYMYTLSFLPPKSSSPSSVMCKNKLSNLWNCSQCHQAFISNTHLQVHLMSHNSKSAPQPPNTVKNHQKQTVIINKAKRKSSETYKGTKRMKRSVSEEEYFKFVPERMLNILNGVKHFKCDICQQCFLLSTKEQFKIHYLKCHINYKFLSVQDRILCSIVDNDLNSIKTNHLYRCHFCNVSFAEKLLLVKHNSEHNQTNVLKCETCQAVFHQSKSLANHVKNCLKPKFPYVSTAYNGSPIHHICRFCKDVTIVSSGEEEKSAHTRDVHCYSNGQLNKECVFGCAFKCKKMCELYKHYTSKHRDVYFSCLPCKERFKTAHDLMVHTASHPNSLKLVNSHIKLWPSATGQRCSLSPSSSCSSNVSDKSRDIKTDVSKKSDPVTETKFPKEYLSVQEKHFQSIFLKNIMKIDVVEQVRVLRENAKLYPDMFKLPKCDLFNEINVEKSEFNLSGPVDEEDFICPVFSSAQEKNVYICKACGVQFNDLSDMTTHTTSEHPYIQNSYYVFDKDDIPENFWDLSSRGLVKTKASSAYKTLNHKTKDHKCSCCMFETRNTFDFHNHLLECANKHRRHSESKPSFLSRIIDKKENHSSESRRRRMAITGVVREVPDDPLFSYKLQLEKTINKPGDSETVFNMLNKLPSKRLAKTTERYDPLQYKNNKDLKQMQTSLERIGFSGVNSYTSIRDYLANFIFPGPELTPSFDTSPFLSEETKIKAKSVKNTMTEELNKTVVDKKLKVGKLNNSDEASKLDQNQKKIKFLKSNSLSAKDNKVNFPKVKSIDGVSIKIAVKKMSKVPKSKNPKGNTKKVKMVKPNGLKGKPKEGGYKKTQKNNLGNPKPTEKKLKNKCCDGEPAPKKRKYNKTKRIDGTNNNKLVYGETVTKSVKPIGEAKTKSPKPAGEAKTKSVKLVKEKTKLVNQVEEAKTKSIETLEEAKAKSAETVDVTKIMSTESVENSNSVGKLKSVPVNKNAKNILIEKKCKNLNIPKKSCQNVCKSRGDVKNKKVKTIRIKVTNKKIKVISSKVNKKMLIKNVNAKVKSKDTKVNCDKHNKTKATSRIVILSKQSLASVQKDKKKLTPPAQMVSPVRISPSTKVSP